MLARSIAICGPSGGGCLDHGRVDPHSTVCLRVLASASSSSNRKRLAPIVAIEMYVSGSNVWALC